MAKLYWSNSWVVWSTFGGSVYLKYMKLYVYCENGLEGMICEVKWWFDMYMHDTYYKDEMSILKGVCQNEVCIDMWSMIMCELWSIWVWACIEVNVMNNVYYLKYVLTFTQTHTWMYERSQWMKMWDCMVDTLHE